MIHFDGAASREGIGASVCIINLEFGKTKLCSFKLVFYCTNNVLEYEVLMLGLCNLKKSRARRIVVYGDSKLVIKQVKGKYQTKHA